MLAVTVDWSFSDDSSSDALCIFGFVDDVMFSYNGGNRPESKMTGMFRRVRQAAALRA